MAKELELTNKKYDYFESSFGCGPCGFGQGAIDKACAKAGDIYVYYRHEWMADTTYAVYKAAEVGAIKDSESVEKFKAIAEFSTLAEAKKSEYKEAFIALRKFVVDSIADRKTKK